MFILITGAVVVNNSCKTSVIRQFYPPVQMFPTWGPGSCGTPEPSPVLSSHLQNLSSENGSLLRSHFHIHVVVAMTVEVKAPCPRECGPGVMMTYFSGVHVNPFFSIFCRKEVNFEQFFRCAVGWYLIWWKEGTGIKNTNYSLIGGFSVVM